MATVLLILKLAKLLTIKKRYSLAAKKHITKMKV